MRIYEMEIWRVYDFRGTVQVKADSEEEAEEKALAQIGNIELQNNGPRTEEDEAIILGCGDEEES